MQDRRFKVEPLAMREMLNRIRHIFGETSKDFKGLQAQPTTYYLRPTTYHLLLTTYHLLPITYYTLPTSHYLLRTTYYVLPTTHYPSIN